MEEKDNENEYSEKQNPGSNSCNENANDHDNELSNNTLDIIVKSNTEDKVIIEETNDIINNKANEDKESKVNESTSKIEETTNINLNDIQMTINKDQSPINQLKRTNSANDNTSQSKTLKSESKDDQYSNQIKDYPESIFTLITEERIQMWLNKLSQNATKISINDSDILNTFLNHDHQYIIKNDRLRTRVREGKLLDSFHEYIEYFLTYYVKQERIQYKQGLNEIFAPFVLLKYKIGISLSTIYILAKRFIDRFLTNYYREMHLIAITASFNLYSILLKYHEPSIYQILEQNLVMPELYITSWVLTLFANKFRLDVVYQIWDYFISFDDSLLIFYIIVSMIQSNKEKLLTCDITCLPKVLSMIYIGSVEEVHSIVGKALELRECTPYSFRILANNLELFKLNNPQLQQAYNLYRPNEILAMPFFPSNLLFHSYNTIVKCPDDRCFVMKNMAYKKVEKDNQIDNNHSRFIPLIKNMDYVCEHCDVKNMKNMSYILLDLRIIECESFEEWNENISFLPNMIMVSQQELKQHNFAKEIISRFNEDKGVIHFVVMTSETDYFRDLENNFYFDNSNAENDLFQIKYGTQTKAEKELNIELTYSMSKKEKMKLQEYDIFKTTLKAFIKADYPYISYAYGGYKNVHNEALKYGITLLNHDKKCYLCKRNKKHDKIPRMSRYKASFYRKNFFIANENDAKSTGNSNIIISSSRILIPSSTSSSSPSTLKRFNSRKEDDKSITFNSYYLSKILETYLTQLLNSGDTHFIECNITKIDNANKKKDTLTNCLFVMNNHEFQIYKIAPSKRKEEDEELNYIDKYLFIDLNHIDLDKKSSVINIKLEGKKELLIYMYSNDKALFIYNLIDSILKE